jgi:hypothetical protein
MKEKVIRTFIVESDNLNLMQVISSNLRGENIAFFGFMSDKAARQSAML